MATELERIAETVEEPEPLKGEVTAAVVRSIPRGRRLRKDLFGPGLFTDPVGDILLELLAVRAGGKEASVNEICRGAGVCSTTGLRWISELAARGLIVRSVDPADRRRSVTKLTEETAAKLASDVVQARLL